jgi:hypothetical protein
MLLTSDVGLGGQDSFVHANRGPWLGGWRLRLLVLGCWTIWLIWARATVSMVQRLNVNDDVQPGRRECGRLELTCMDRGTGALKRT